MKITKQVLKSRSEWLKNRQGGIGGSEIASVIGLNPYMSNIELWEIKTGRREREDISEKPYVKYGTKAEEYLRNLFALDFPEYKVFYVENNSFTNDRYPWGKASVDGWLEDENGRKGILEIKTSTINGVAQRSKWKDRIPNNYYCQCLFYMAMLNADFCVLKAQLKSEYEGELNIQTNIIE